MAEWLQMAASLVSVLMLCGVIFNFSVIKPLNESVRSLRDCIAELRRQLSDTEAKRQKMAERLSRVEALAEHAHRRLDATSLPFTGFFVALVIQIPPSPGVWRSHRTARG